jgi:hypothetical protein
MSTRRGSSAAITSPAPSTRRASVSVVDTPPLTVAEGLGALAAESALANDVIQALERVTQAANESRTQAREGKGGPGRNLREATYLKQMVDAGVAANVVLVLGIHVRNKIVCGQVLTCINAMAIGRYAPPSASEAFVKAGVARRLDLILKHHTSSDKLLERTLQLLTYFDRLSLPRALKWLAPLRTMEACPLAYVQWHIGCCTPVDFYFYEEQRAEQIEERQKREKEAAAKQAREDKKAAKKKGGKDKGGKEDGRRDSTTGGAGDQRRGSVTSGSARRASVSGADKGGSSGGNNGGSGGDASSFARVSSATIDEEGNGGGVGGSGAGGGGVDGSGRRNSLIVGRNGVLTEAVRQHEIVHLSGAGISLSAEAVRKVLSVTADFDEGAQDGGMADAVRGGGGGGQGAGRRASTTGGRRASAAGGGRRGSAAGGAVAADEGGSLSSAPRVFESENDQPYAVPEGQMAAKSAAAAAATVAISQRRASLSQRRASLPGVPEGAQAR